MPPATPASAPPYPVSGWIEAGLFVFAIGVLSIGYVIGQQIGAHPIAQILYGLCVSGLVLLAIAGPGPDALRIVLSPRSWLIGVGIIAMEAFYYVLLAQVTPALGSLLVRLATPIAMLTGWALVARRPPRLAMLGAGIILAAVAPLFVSIDPQHRLPAAGAAIGSALAFTLRTFAAEFHPWNRRAKTVIEKLRVTGLVMLVTSLASLMLTGVCAFLIARGTLPATPMLPTLDQMLHVPTILLGCLLGGAVFTAMSVFSFSAVVKITSENFTATTALSPVATLIVQLAAGGLGIIPLYPIDAGLLPAMGVVVAGVLLILYAARR